MKFPTIALLTICSQIALSQALYTSKDDVNLLTPQTFGPAVMDTNQLVAVEFYAPWCGHCQRLAPEWKKAATNLKGLVSVNAVDCDVEANKPLCATYDIKGFPTIKIFPPELRKHKKTGKLSKVPTDYQGPRDAKSIVDYLLSNQPSNVLFVKWNEKDVKSKKSITLDNFLSTQNETLPKALLFTDKPTTTPLYKALSVEFKDRLLMGEVKQSEKNIVNEFNIQSFPTLAVISPEHGTVQFEGKLKRDALKSFLEKYALKSKTSGNDNKGSSDSSQPKKTTKVEAITTNDSLKQHCLNTNQICVLVITDDQDKQETIDILNVLKDKNDKFQYGWMHASQSADIVNALQLPQDYPSLFILHPSKHAFRNYVGAFDENKIHQWLNRVSSGAVDAWAYKGDIKLIERQHDEL
ncbi:thioredoxin-domain-containing protein [Rhizopus microsporus ATCC 52813]|uniref:protein disulfide-isomerase n=1 Tax=Rhizopus microsporus ATCC 52813 TaxID=1340429 RepID=A0A2G4SGV1_RHIZD|nr:thioredoxin-domain-containing protein [Rhizopus microsporus ATCC 52813]PHZ07997.1 thioredoxin-domain-containing protein [Rhizopus microsporus ATCC 52813]